LQAANAEAYAASVVKILDEMNKIFVKSDPLLRQIGMTVLYFYVFRRAAERMMLSKCNRETFVGFERTREQNRVVAGNDIGQANYQLLEFDQQPAHEVGNLNILSRSRWSSSSPRGPNLLIRSRR
jgi:hypothetical protein